MTAALVLGLVPSAAYGAAMGVAAEIVTPFSASRDDGRSQLERFGMDQEPAPELGDGNALLRRSTPNTGMASANRKRKADGKESTSFMGSVSL